MFIQPFVQPANKNPIVRTYPYSVQTLEFDVCGLNAERTEEHLAKVRDSLHIAGLGHIKITTSKSGEKRWGYVFIHETQTVYHLEWTDNPTTNNANRRMVKVRDNILALVKWFEANCVGKTVIDERGVVFEEEEDSILFKLRWL